MISRVNRVFCVGCSACASACPQKCIALVSDNEGFLYPSINNDICMECNLCEKVCPVLYPNQKNEDPVAYAIQNIDLETRRISSSGGVFALVANKVLHNGGMVFGAVLDENMNVIHQGTERSDELMMMYGSKYVQSVIGESYVQVKNALQQGREVLFSGTTCQVEGLYNYLGRRYSNLLTIDFVCHGVPSPMVWNRYMEWQSGKARKQIASVSFRNKHNGWKDYMMQIVFSDNTTYLERATKDLFMKAFLADLCLRPSCYRCPFKGVKRTSDLTLADFWRIENVLPDFDDDMGTSLVFSNSVKGETCIEGIRNHVKMQRVQTEDVLQYNAAILNSAREPNMRSQFMRSIDEKRFDLVVRKYCPTPSKMQFYSRKIINRIKRNMNNLKQIVMKNSRRQ